VLTDRVRPAAPMERLRAKWPHTLVLDFAPDSEMISAAADLSRLARIADPVQICGHFIEFTSGGAADEDQRAVLRDVIEAVLASDNADSVDEWLANAGRASDWLADSDVAFPERTGRHAAGGNPAAA
jgi:hypothetical protein